MNNKWCFFLRTQYFNFCTHKHSPENTYYKYFSRLTTRWNHHETAKPSPVQIKLAVIALTIKCGRASRNLRTLALLLCSTRSFEPCPSHITCWRCARSLWCIHILMLDFLITKPEDIFSDMESESRVGITHHWTEPSIEYEAFAVQDNPYKQDVMWCIMWPWSLII